MTAPDLLRRFTPTPLIADLHVMGRTIRLETDSALILERTSRLFDRQGPTESTPPEFLWRIVVEEQPRLGLRWPEVTAFSDEGLSFVNLDRRNFIAVDLASHQAIGFLSPEVASHEIGFRRHVLAVLFSLAAPALGLSPLPAVCIERDEKGLLIFGQTPSVATAFRHLAATTDLAFDADAALFLERRDPGLRVWSQSWLVPAARESEPALRAMRASARSDFNSGSASRRLIPAACIFLEGLPSVTPRLTPLSSTEIGVRLAENRFSRSGEYSPSELTAIGGVIGRVPAYELNYGGDPRDAAVVLRSLMIGQGLWEFTP